MNFWSSVNQHIGVLFDVVNDTSKALEKLMTTEKEEFKRMLCLFWGMIKVFEFQVSPQEHANFQSFYKEFYHGFSFLRYKVEESYNIQTSKFYNIFLKVKVNDKLIKKDW